MNARDAGLKTWLVVSETVLGIMFSLILMKLIDDTNHLLGEDYIMVVIKFYGILSFAFFLAVFPIGIYGAIKLKQEDKIKRAIFYSIIFWALSLIVSIISSGVLYAFSIYIILIAIVFGFNIGLGFNSKKRKL
jgi:hypothetical protein